MGRPAADQGRDTGKGALACINSAQQSVYATVWLKWLIRRTILVFWLSGGETWRRHTFQAVWAAGCYRCKCTANHSHHVVQHGSSGVCTAVCAATQERQL